MEPTFENSNSGSAIIIFVRNPVLGKVKTRLAVTTGEEKALSIYRELLQYTFDITESINADKFVFYADSISDDDLWTADGFVKRVQSKGNLGCKMKDAFDELLNNGYKKVVIIGSDCFELTTVIIDGALKKLDDYDVVIGPAKDGGYYLLGTKKIFPFLFENKQWSSDSVYSKTIEDIKTHNLLFHSLEILTDIDTEEDWLKSKKNTS
ncbi:MAG TPA: TIGR04282 family arsenosugar biosynthesis glycosyltransferase [Ginsengibacter sp.]